MPYKHPKVTNIKIKNFILLKIFVQNFDGRKWAGPLLAFSMGIAKNKHLNRFYRAKVSGYSV